MQKIQLKQIKLKNLEAEVPAVKEITRAGFSYSLKILTQCMIISGEKKV